MLMKYLRKAMSSVQSVFQKVKVSRVLLKDTASVVLDRQRTDSITE